MIEIANSIATVISSLAALATIYLVIKQYKDSKKSDTKHFGIEIIYLIMI